MLKCGFKIGVDDINLYVKAKDEKLIVVVLYVDDIIFANDSVFLTNKFVVDMKIEFEMYILGELSYFLGL